MSENDLRPLRSRIIQRSDVVRYRAMSVPVQTNSRDIGVRCRDAPASLKNLTPRWNARHPILPLPTVHYAGGAAGIRYGVFTPPVPHMGTDTAIKKCATEAGWSENMWGRAPNFQYPNYWLPPLKMGPTRQVRGSSPTGIVRVHSPSGIVREPSPTRDIRGRPPSASALRPSPGGHVRVPSPKGVICEPSLVHDTRGPLPTGNVCGPSPKHNVQSAYDLIIVGGGVAAGYLCRELVSHNFPGSILVVSNEPVAPYERPALTKAYLNPPHARVRARLPHFHTSVGTGGPLQDATWYTQHNITLCLNTMVTHVNVDAMTCALLSKANGRVETVKYQRLVNAAGSSAITLADVGIAGDGLPNVYAVRSEEDASRLVTALEHLKRERREHGRVVVLGGGFIGLEVAAAVSGWGFQTIVVHSGPIMARFFPPHVAECVTDAYTARGIQFVNGRAAAVEKTHSSVASVRLQDGCVLDADIVLIGIGAKPTVVLPTARQQEHNGCILVSHKMVTSLPNCLAIGDVAAPRISGKDYVRLQEVNWARKSAEMAAKTLCGVEYKFDYLPFNYSRVFEYTDAPLAWNFFGKTKGDVVRLKTPKSTSAGALWVEGGRVNGALLLDSPAPSEEEIADIKRLVVENAKVPQRSSLLLWDEMRQTLSHAL